MEKDIYSAALGGTKPVQSQKTSESANGKFDAGKKMEDLGAGSSKKKRPSPFALYCIEEKELYSCFLQKIEQEKKEYLEHCIHKVLARALFDEQISSNTYNNISEYTDGWRHKFKLVRDEESVRDGVECGKIKSTKSDILYIIDGDIEDFDDFICSVNNMIRTPLAYFGGKSRAEKAAEKAAEEAAKKEAEEAAEKLRLEKAVSVRRYHDIVEVLGIPTSEQKALLLEKFKLTEQDVA